MLAVCYFELCLACHEVTGETIKEELDWVCVLEISLGPMFSVGYWILKYECEQFLWQKSSTLQS
jgi:hypothetical protein